MSDGIPAFLTVEEVMALLRMGRTKVYGLTTEWRVTNGRSGLRYASRNPMRIPRAALEEMAGGPLDADLLKLKHRTQANPSSSAVAEPTEAEPKDQSRLEMRRRARGSRRPTLDQPGLFDLPPAS